MSLPDLPKPNETWAESALAAHQVMSNQFTEANAQLQSMSEQIKKLTSVVDKLQRQLKLNSKTSSKPPSSDRERRASKTRKKSERAKGAQKGHKGSTRVQLKPDEIISCQPIEPHCDCGGAWIERETFRLPQVTELPEVKPVVTEHQERCLSCERCGRETYAGARLPLGESRFGPRLHAVVVSLNLESRLSFRQIRALLKQSFNLSVSVGTISCMVKRAAQHTKRFFEELKAWFQADNQPKHIDETSWKIHGDRAQLIGSLNASAALYQCSQHRKAEETLSA